MDSQVVNLASSGADVFVNFATASFVTQSLKKAHELGWKPETYIYSGATDTNFVLAPAGLDAAEGVHSFYWIYDVSSADHDQRPGMRNWRASPSGMPKRSSRPTPSRRPGTTLLSCWSPPSSR